MATRVDQGSALSPRLPRRSAIATGVSVPGAAVPLSACFTIANFDHVLAAYGEKAAGDLLQGVRNGLVEWLGQEWVADVGRGRFRVDVDEASVDCSGGLETWASRVDEACRALSFRPFDTAGGRICAWVSASLYESGHPVSRVDRDAPAAFVGAAVGAGADWVPRYRADMALVVAVADLLAADGAGTDILIFNWQVVRSASQKGVLYSECQSRLVGSDGQMRGMGLEIAALERVGFARLYDRHVAEFVLAALEDHPGLSLGFNISAQSARWDVWWEDFASRLQAVPGLAGRLVVELTETAPLSDVAEAVRCTTRLQRLGCRIALDDFGSGHTAMRYLWALAPDLVKIGRVFVAQLEHSDRARRAFFHLARLAESSAAIVIAEGVETSAQADLAREMGVDWQQGRHWGQPSFSSRNIEGKATADLKPSSFAGDDRTDREPGLGEGRTGRTEPVPPVESPWAEAVDAVDVAAHLEGVPAELRFFKGLLVALPLSGLLWVGILRLGGVL